MIPLFRRAVLFVLVACNRDGPPPRRCEELGEVQQNLDEMTDAMMMFTHADDIARGRFPPGNPFPRGPLAREGWRVPTRVKPWRELPFASLSFPQEHTNFRYGWRVARAQRDQSNPWPHEGTRKVDLDVLVYAECRLEDGRKLYVWRDYWEGVDGWRWSPLHKDVLAGPPWPLYDYPTQ